MPRLICSSKSVAKNAKNAKNTKDAKDAKEGRDGACSLIPWRAWRSPRPWRLIRAFENPDRHVLRLQERFEPLAAQLATPPAVLEPAERGVARRRDAVVDADRSGLELLGDA